MQPLTGAEIALLALIDADPPYSTPTSALLHHVSRYLFQLRQWLHLPAAERLPFIARKARIEYGRISTKVRSLYDKKTQIESTRTTAIERGYQARPYDGSITIFLARDTHFGQLPANDPRLVWCRFAKGGVQIHELPGEHVTVMREPNARASKRVEAKA